MFTKSGPIMWLALVVAAALATPALDAAGGKGDPKVYRTRVFRLKNFDPEAAKDLLEELLTEPLDVLGPGRPGAPGGGGNLFDLPGGGLAGRGPGLGGGGPSTAGAGVTLPPAPGANPAGGSAPGGLGGPSTVGGLRGPGAPGAAAPGGKRFPGQRFPGQGGGDMGTSGERYRLMVDDKSRSIIMRGPEPDVNVAVELMNILELPADRPLPANLVAIRAFRVEAEPEKLAEKLQGLGYKAKLVAVSSLNLIVAAGPDEDLKEITDAIKALMGDDKGGAEEKPAKPKDPRPPTSEEEEGRNKIKKP